MRKLFFVSLSILFLVSCGENTRKSARKLLENAEHSVEIKKFNTAKSQIDSINNKYPAEIKTRKAANLLFTQIELLECERDLDYLTKSYAKKKASLDSLFKYFSLEKNTKFQYYGEYIHRNMTKERNPTNSYIKVHVLENGRMYLTCVYFGYDDFIYKSLKISHNGFYTETSIYSPRESRNYLFNDGNYYWRTLIIKEDESKNIIDFIDNYASKNIKVSLMGNWEYSYILHEKYKEAVKDACLLSTLIKETKALRKNMTKTERQIFAMKIKRDRQQ